MKKLIAPILIITLILSGCNGGKEEHKSKQHKTNTKKTEKTDTNKNKVKNTKIFIEDAYTKDNIRQYRNIKDFVTKEKLKSVANQNQSYKGNHQKDVEKRVDDLKIYKPVNTKSNELMYSVHLKTVNKKTKNIIFTENIGRINYKKEDNKQKLSKFTQISQREIYNSKE